MTNPNDPAIQIIDAFATKDGKRFYSADEAKAHVRHEMLLKVHSDLVKKDIRFAQMDRDLFIDALKECAKLAAAVMTSALDPQRVERAVPKPTPPEPPTTEPFRPAVHLRPATPPPVDALKTAMQRVDSMAVRAIEEELSETQSNRPQGFA